MANWERLKIVADSIVQHLDRLDQIELLERLAVFYYDDLESPARNNQPTVERSPEANNPSVIQTVEPVPRIHVSTSLESDFQKAERSRWIVIDGRLLRQNGFSVQDLRSLVDLA